MSEEEKSSTAISIVYLLPFYLFHSSEMNIAEKASGTLLFSWGQGQTGGFTSASIYISHSSYLLRK